MDGINQYEERMITIRYAQTTHERDGAEVTDPIRKRPKSMTRREWRELVRKGYRAVKCQELQNRREEAALPESVKLDRRLHAAGLLSPRDLSRVRPVTIDVNLVGV
jgi:hypothetical protein